MIFRFAPLALVIISLSACSSGIIPNQGPSTASTPVVQPVPSTPASPLPAAIPAANILGDGMNAVSLGVRRAGAIGAMQVDRARSAAAMAAFRTSCPGLLNRDDLSGLTLKADWQPACDAVKTWTGDGISFFATYMDAVQIGDGAAFATGYYEPEISASRVRMPGYETPIYRKPNDLIEVDLGQFSDDLKGKKVRGKVQDQKLVLYNDREEIEEGALSGRGLEIAYAADPVEFFFLQIQGSGRLRFPDGSVARIGYDNQNGREYTGIGRLMKERGQLIGGDASMQGLVAWLRANPAEGRAVMRENKSFIFFREMTGSAGPVGAMGYPVTPEITVAADRKYMPLGAPIWLSMDRAEPNGIWIAQDTGGAIKGANRVDTFWGAGERATAIAGGMAARGSALIFLPKASVERLTR